MTELFADTFYFLALLNQDDAAHEKAVEAAKTLKARLVTTGWILTEVADALADPAYRSLCLGLIEDLRRQPRSVILSATQELFDAGLDLYRKRPDKDWGLTDCISFYVMQDRQISEALTGDHHFEQAGFVALLK